jgi:hypothetical protein
VFIAYKVCQRFTFLVTRLVGWIAKRGEDDRLRFGRQE